MTFQEKQLRAKRYNLFEQMKALVKTAEAEKRNLTSDEDARFNSLDKEIEALNTQLHVELPKASTRQERVAELDADMRQPVDTPQLHPIHGDAYESRAHEPWVNQQTGEPLWCSLKRSAWPT